MLNQLLKYHFLTQEAYEKLKQLPLDLQYKVENHNLGPATYFRSAIRGFLLDWTQKHGYDLFEDGLRIYTTIDSRLQKHAEDVLGAHMKVLQQKFDQHWIDQNPWTDQRGKEIKNFVEETAKKSELYRELVAIHGSDASTIDSVMHTPIPMKLFSWEGEIDSTISPIEAVKYNKRLLHAGFMAMNPHTGHIKAWVGGINYQYFQYDHVIQGRRQPGSAFKPIVYAAALDNGYSPCYEVVDAPVTFKLPGRLSTWTPKNAEGFYTGRKMTLRQAMSRSVNSITAYITKQIGVELVVDYARRLGIKSPMDAVPALCLGASDLSLYELIGAYSVFMNKGIWTEPFFITRIEDKHGRILQEFVPQKKEAISEETAWLMMHMLKGTVEENGTFRGLSKEMKEENEICGKTGTTSNQSDGWCIGMTRDLCSGVWVGGEDRCIHFRTLTEGQGAVTARPIWEKFMLRIYADPELSYEKGPLPKPAKPLDLPCVKPSYGKGMQDEVQKLVEIQEDSCCIENDSIQENSVNRALDVDSTYDIDSLYTTF